MRPSRAFAPLHGHGIGFRLRAASAVLVILAALQVLIGLYCMTQIHQRVGDMYSQELVALEAMDDAKSAMYWVRGDSLEHVLAASNTSEERLATQIFDQRTRVRERVRQ